jgi:hypothetical protein
MRAAIALVGVVVAVGSAVAAVAVRGAPDDPRACPGSTQNLSIVLAHFGTALPSDAFDIRYYSVSQPLVGVYGIRVAFRTSDRGLTRFRASTGLISDVWQPISFPVVDVRCDGLELRQRNVRSSDSTGPGEGKAIDVDMTNPRRPLVLFQVSIHGWG